MTTSGAGYLPANAARHLKDTGRPLVTVSYAQSLDGSLTLLQGQPSPVSGQESMRITHELRAAHQAIVVGIGTVLSDDPQLTVRLVEGQHPQPIVLDSHLRFPLTARLVDHPNGVLIATTTAAEGERQAPLDEAGLRIIVLPPDDTGRVSLDALLDKLGQEGVSTVMVEGGGQVITSFLRDGQADRAVLTLAPVFAGGYPAVQDLSATQWADLPRLSNLEVMQIGNDLIVWGDIA